MTTSNLCHDGNDNTTARAILMDACALNNMGVAMMVHGEYPSAVTTFKDSLCILQAMLQEQPHHHHHQEQDTVLHAAAFFRQERLRAAAARVAQLTTNTGTTTTATTTTRRTHNASSSSSLSSLKPSLRYQPQGLEGFSCVLGPQEHNLETTTRHNTSIKSLNVVENNDTPSLIQAAMASGADASQRQTTPSLHELTTNSSALLWDDKSTTILLIREPTTTTSTTTTTAASGTPHKECYSGAMESGIVLYNYGVACSLLLATRTDRLMTMNQQQQQQNNPATAMMMLQHNSSLAQTARKLLFLSHDSFVNAASVAQLETTVPDHPGDVSFSYACHPGNLEVSLFILLALSEASKVHRHEQQFNATQQQQGLVAKHHNSIENNNSNQATTALLAAAVSYYQHCPEQEQMQLAIVHMMEELEWYAKSPLFSTSSSAATTSGDKDREGDSSSSSSSCAGVMVMRTVAPAA